MFGFREAPPDLTHRLGIQPHDPAKLGCALGAVPQSHSFAHRVQGIYPQGSANSCVGHGVCGAAQTARARVEASPPLASRLAVYRWARSTHGEAGVDNGTYVPSAFTALAQLGMPSEQVWPYSDSFDRVVEPIPFDVYHAAADARWVAGYYRVVAGGHTRVEQIKAALAQGHPVVFGLLADRAFVDYEGGTWDKTGATVGGHCVYAVGYTHEGVLVANSWAEWGEVRQTAKGPLRGFGVVGWDTIMSSSVMDPFVVESPPQVGS